MAACLNVIVSTPNLVARNAFATGLAVLVLMTIGTAIAGIVRHMLGAGKKQAARVAEIAPGQGRPAFYVE